VAIRSCPWVGADALFVGDDPVVVHVDATIGDATWTHLEDHYPPGALVEIPVIVGQYTMLSMLANAAGVDLEADLERLPNQNQTEGA
jgi:hypothetical protein